MATLVSRNGAMAQQPLHHFFVQPKKAEPLVPQHRQHDNKDDATLYSLSNPNPACHSDGPVLEPCSDGEPKPKRRRTASLEQEQRRPAPTAGRRDSQIVGRTEETRDQTSQSDGGRKQHIIMDARVPHIPVTQSSQRMPTPPTSRLLTLRADGKLKSPSSTDLVDEEPKPRKRRAGTRRGKHLILRYGRTPHERLTFGKKIDQVMAGKLRHGSALITVQGEGIGGGCTARESTNVGSKNTHPFFTGKSKRVGDAANEIVHSSLKPDTGTELPRKRLGPSLPFSSTSLSSFGTSFSKTPKQPGSLQSPWPPAAMQHVRGAPSNQLSAKYVGNNQQRSERKAKGIKATVALNDEVCQPQEELIRSVKAMQGQGEHGGALSIRLRKPCKHLMTGRSLRERLREQLVMNRPNTQLASSLLRMVADGSIMQPYVLDGLSSAARCLYGRVEGSLSAFDRFECDTLNWCHKYAPRRGEEVLQDQNTIALLRDWIKARNVDTVDTGTGGKDMKLNAAKQIAAKRRKRKIKDELDDFIASSDDASDVESEAAEADHTACVPIGDDIGGPVSQAQLQTLRTGNLHATRAVLVTGPHGSGKTASVYALAAELGYEIFEINSGTRRNGRDIMERVGDMTRNHLVSNDRTPVSEIEATESVGTSLPSEETVDPKQQSVASFFKSKPQTAVTKKATATKKTAQVDGNRLPSKPRKQHKQSLILVEEVDVLFEEDKPFWTTIFTLIVQSRRPIIMTCADEDRLPLSEFIDTAQLPFYTQNQEILSDYLLCLAANEGHLLSRTAVAKALSIRRNDLRGTISDLQFWCQMAVGDEKAGIGWFMDANTANIERNPSTPPLRTVSENTYPEHVTFLPEIADDLADLQSQARLRQESFNISSYSGLGRSDWIVTEHFSPGTQPQQDLVYQDLRCDLLSVADVLPFAPKEYESLDCSQPLFNEKVLRDTVSGYRLLQIDPKVDPTGVAESMYFTMQALGHRLQFAPSEDGQTWRKSWIENALARKPDLYGQMRLARSRLSTAFEPLEETPDGNPWAPQRSSGISALRGSASLVATDIAPILRSIVRSDLQLEEERARLSHLLADRGPTSKRQRTTRAARAALEGGSKASTRKDRWLPKEVDYSMVLRTGGSDWYDLSALQGNDSYTRSSAATPSSINSRQQSCADSDDELVSSNQ